jgi:hypothetical protein
VLVTEGPDGFSIQRHDETFEKGLEIARKGMKQYRNTLTELAK